MGVGFYRGSTSLAKGKGWLFRMTNTGELLWEHTYSDSLLRPWSPQLELLDLCEMADGRIAATGIAFDTNSVALLNPNVVVLVVDANGCLEPECTGLNQYITSTLEPIFKFPDLLRLTITPNPSNGPVRVTLPTDFVTGNLGYELRCYDLLGNLIRRFNWPQGASVLEIKDVFNTSGAYNLILFAQNRPIATGKLFIQH